ncbi:GspH/FimT family pseudopilin [Rhodanobacter sp. C05]|uniref:GspH/FimT family pseudopilin n=1 Tax=Rhodanobacter sp. C05 TaxID=1945855 RepID=UPI00117A6D69|nr:GspH/FimT family pseudopilin [Rhodanobacter sp. C05]
MACMSNRQRGFSLIELMVTILVAAILLAIAVPSFRDVIHRNQVSSASNELLASMAYARTEAVTRGQLVSMCPSSDGANCTPSGQTYDPGWIVYTYPAGAASANKVYDTTDILLRATGTQSGVSIQSLGTTVITFGQQGQLDPAATTLEFTTCYRDSSSGTGTSTSTVPGVELQVSPLGSGQTSSIAAGASCTPS